MKITMLGVGYAGLVTGTCLAEKGHKVICVDKDEVKIADLRLGQVPIYEPGLAKLMKQNCNAGRLSFTTKLQKALEVSEVCFIAVGTPMGEDGSADMRYVLEAAREIGQCMSAPLLIADKSTVPVGTTDRVRSIIQEELDKRKLGLPFDVVSNPEFLREGNACEDFLYPERVIVGADNEQALEMMRELYKPFLSADDAFLGMDVRSAEMTKYAANAMLATKISFINEIANLCEQIGADVNEVRRGIGSDSRIGRCFLNAGCGYGGSCIPKDVQALIKTGIEYGCSMEILQAVENVNVRQKHLLVAKITKFLGDDLSGRKIAVWGLSFKPETDDMRGAPAVTVIRELVQRQAEVTAYDPKAMQIAEDFYLKNLRRLSYAQDKYVALEGADALVLLTEWQEFLYPDFEEMHRRMRGRHIFDGRNQYDKELLGKFGFVYHQVGVRCNGESIHTRDTVG